MPFSPFELAYKAVQSFSNPSTSKTDQMNIVIDEYSHLSHLESISMLYPFDKEFVNDEGIMEVMNLDEIPWDDYNHRSSF